MLFIRSRRLLRRLCGQLLRDYLPDPFHTRRGFTFTPFPLCRLGNRTAHLRLRYPTAGDLRPDLLPFGLSLWPGQTNGRSLLPLSCPFLFLDGWAADLLRPFAALGLVPVNLADLSREVGETVAGRPGGAVSLAIGFAQIFSGLPGLQGFMSFWYHFAIMFEALFILTTVDAGTRVARFLVQEFGGRFYPPFARQDWMPGTIISTSLVVVAWGYFIWTGSIGTIWPMFGISNQLLAVIALLIGTTIIIRSGRARLAWVTILPLTFLGGTYQLRTTAVAKAPVFITEWGYMLNSSDADFPEQLRTLAEKLDATLWLDLAEPGPVRPCPPSRSAPAGRSPPMARLQSRPGSPRTRRYQRDRARR